MILAAAFVPSTPLLVPEAAAGAAAELDEVRSASLRALADALGTGPQRVVVLGSSSRVIGTPPVAATTPPVAATTAPVAATTAYAAATTTYAAGLGTLRGFGVALDVPLDPASPSLQRLSLASTVGAWLLARSGWSGERRAVELDPGSDDSALDACGCALADDVATVLLVVADGSAARTEKAPASLHPGAAAFDASVAAALGSGDPSRLAAIDRRTASQVSAAGRPAWRAASAALAGAAYDAALLCDVAPYGVGYLAARWSR